MNPMFNEYKDAGKIQEALLIGRNMVNKAPGDSECVNAYLDFLLMLAEKLPRTDERKSFADQANLVLSFYEENGGKSGVASGVQSVVGYGIGRTIGQIATNAIEGVLSNAGLEITANISKMCTMGTVGAITVAVFSTVQFVKLIYHGECLKSAAIQVGKQALFSLSLLAISIAAQGMWGGPAGIIVSIGTGIVIVSYTIADAVHQRTFAEECHIKTIEEYGRLALRHLNELQFA